jgi:MoxR-like ATPase
MNWPETVNQTLKRLNNAKRTLKGLFTGRDRAVDLLVLATVCQEHLLFIGPPGTAKTALINAYTALIDAIEFSYLLTRFTEPSELFGPLDLSAFQAGTYKVSTEGMLPQAQIVFLDEVFQGSSAILNSLLTILNERTFYNGANRQTVPLISMIGASNFIPDDPSLQAFGDRFVLRLEVNKVEDEQLDDLLNQGWDLERERITTAQRLAEGKEVGKVIPDVKIQNVLALHPRLLEVNLQQVQPQYSQIIRELRAEGLDFSDRRVVKGLKLIAGASLLRGASSAEIVDLWPLFHLWDRPADGDILRTILQPRLEEAGLEFVERVRPLSEILMDLETLNYHLPPAPSEAALGACLMALNKLRHEVIAQHPQETNARQRINDSIQTLLQKLNP